MPFDLSTVNWGYVTIMSVGALVASLIGNLVAYRNRFAGAILTGLIFAIMFVLWNYYPHDFGLPIIDKFRIDGGANPI